MGTRLKPITNRLPKVMIPVKGKPILEYHVRQLAEAGIKEIFINLYHLPEKIKGYFEDGKKWNLNIRYSFEPILLGTAGAIKNLEKELGIEPFLVVYGDNFLHMNYRDFIRYSESTNGIGTVAVFEKEDVLGSGILDFNKRKKVIRFEEKPRKEAIFSHWVSAGIFYFRNRIFKYIHPGYSDFGYDVLSKIVSRNEKLHVYKCNRKVWSIDRPELLSELLRQDIITLE